MSDFAPIDPVLQHQIERAAGKMLAAGHPSAGSFTALAHNILSVEFGLEQRDRAQFRIVIAVSLGSLFGMGRRRAASARKTRDRDKARYKP